MGSTERRLSVYLRTETFDQAVHLDRFVSWCLNVSSPKPTFPPQMCSRADRSTPLFLRTADVHKPFVQTSSILWTFRFAVLSPSFHVGIE